MCTILIRSQIHQPLSINRPKIFLDNEFEPSTMTISVIAPYRQGGTHRTHTSYRRLTTAHVASPIPNRKKSLTISPLPVTGVVPAFDVRILECHGWSALGSRTWRDIRYEGGWHTVSRDATPYELEAECRGLILGEQTLFGQLFQVT